ncbi:MAG: hypothetical protein BACA_02010 [Bacteroides fragilis]|mgnify:FL=1|nr:MAG: hypothetical protein [Bacteriophage sp.]
MEKKFIDFEEMMEKLALNCKEKKIDGICILTTQGEEKSGIAALQCGEPTEIIMAIIKIMHTDPRARTILETAVQFYKSYPMGSGTLEIRDYIQN